jgi:hypothetical protein
VGSLLKWMNIELENGADLSDLFGMFPMTVLVSLLGCYRIVRTYCKFRSLTESSYITANIMFN